MGLLLRLVEHHEEITGIHLIPLIDPQLQDPSGCLGRQFHLAEGIQGADRVHPIGEDRQLRRSHLNLGRWRLLRGLALAGTDDGKGHQWQNQSLRSAH